MRMDGAALLAALGGSSASGASMAAQSALKGANGAKDGKTQWIQFNGVVDSLPIRSQEVRK